MSDLYDKAVTAAADSHGITWQDASDIVTPFLDFVRGEKWDYGFSDQPDPILEVLRDESGQ